ncbi:hypothetical protein CCM_08847 [Cordyceps militaris CM01]|uniref:Uncharacterized protein n=1 Tax=Cordyceps militaris (strain CM01) TaxID=983644 RepID=G3JSA2_CORMM|nr:uncharacterized protein CCM_08847 [Cordyceps militaris CM01]EGX88801.1 hypothetical protein CCM_08847 [Cordyceps militaris CM01]
MRYFCILIIPSVLAAATRLSPRQETEVVADADQLLTLRANFCIDYTKPECEDAIATCQDGGKIIEDCIRDEHPACIKDAASPCSQAVEKCLADFGAEEDADQAVHDCIIEKVISEGAGDDELPAETGSTLSPEEATACKKASAEFQVAMLDDDCDVVEDGDEGVAKRADSAACEAAAATFEKAWKDHSCEKAFGAQEE